VNNVASSIIKNPQSVQPSLRMPVGMGDGTVDNKMPECDEDDHGVVFHAISETAADEAGGDDGECKLIRAEYGFRNGRC
jgi:hypothetical protein